MLDKHVRVINAPCTFEEAVFNIKIIKLASNVKRKWFSVCIQGNSQ